MEIYLVGGAVRDKLLGRKVTEQDWVVIGATPEMMLAQGFAQVGKDFPVFLHPRTKEEYALARTERKSGLGYTGFICDFSPDITLEDDLLRRDLTINAMAEKDGEIVDPFGGQQDLKNRILRHVSPTFREDPLRVLRVARFAARYAYLGFSVADETLSLLQEISASGELENLTIERVWQETERALSENTPSVYFQVLRDAHALAVLFPEVDRLFGVPQRAEYHPEIDTGIHTLMVLDQAAKLSDKTAVRFAALLHDLGKADTPKSEWPRHIQHEQRGLPRVRELCARLRPPKMHQELAEMASLYHLECHRVHELRPETLLKKLSAMDAFRRTERFEDFLLVCEADARGRLGFEEKEYPQAAYFREALDIAKAVDIKPLLEQGYKGTDLATAIERSRTQALSTWKQGKSHE